MQVLNEMPSGKKLTTNQQKLINLVCPDKFRFIEKRVDQYENIFEYQVDSQIKSMQFIEFKEIEENQELLVYFGPAISTDNTYIYFLLDIIKFIIQKHSGKKILLLAEIQNPKLFFRLKDFFGEIAGPKDFNHISEQETINLTKFYNLFNHLLDPRLNNGWISKSTSNKNFCTSKLAATKENKYLLDSGINLLEMEQILFLVEFPRDPQEQRNIFEKLKAKTEDKFQTQNIIQLLLKSKGEQNGASNLLCPN